MEPKKYLLSDIMKLPSGTRFRHPYSKKLIWEFVEISCGEVKYNAIGRDDPHRTGYVDGWSKCKYHFLLVEEVKMTFKDLSRGDMFSDLVSRLVKVDHEFAIVVLSDWLEVGSMVKLKRDYEPKKILYRAKVDTVL